MGKALRRQLGEILCEEGIISRSELRDALDTQQQGGGSLGQILVEKGYCTDEDIAGALEIQLGIARVSLENRKPEPEVVRLISTKLAKKYGVIPLKRKGRRLTVAMADPSNLVAIDDLRIHTGFAIDPVIADPGEIQEAIDCHLAPPVEELVGEVERRFAEGEGTENRELDIDRLRELTEEAPIVRLTNHILQVGIREEASDIHLEPRPGELVVRMRIDGQLQELLRLPGSCREAVTSRLKIMSRLDIAEKRLPQDGRIQIDFEGRTVDFRVATVPTIYGEKVAIRILDPQSGLKDLEELGLKPDFTERIAALIGRPHGMFLVTGPTGSGKTTTLYAALEKLRDGTRHIITIEDPVEYRLSEVNQIQIREEIGLDFFSSLKAVLRQDPDVIMVGEIRDQRTARTAVQAALTGHLVFSTLHTNGAAGAVSRLLEMKVEPFLVASALNGVLAQRLVRTNCSQCKSSRLISIDKQRKMGIEPDYEQPMAVYTGKGCEVCGNSGYKGRTGIFELLVVDDTIRELIQEQKSTSEIEEAAYKAGMEPLFQNGMEKVITGQTSLEELLRVTGK